jgi:hypothetical protein
VVADGSSGYRDSRLWLEALLRKTPVPYGEQALTVPTHVLADALAYQQTAVTKALDPQHIRPRTLIADAVGLGKTLEIGIILAELVHRGAGNASSSSRCPRPYPNGLIFPIMSRLDRVLASLGCGQAHFESGV